MMCVHFKNTILIEDNARVVQYSRSLPKRCGEISILMYVNSTSTKRQ